MEAAVRQRFERIEAILDGVAKSHASAIARMDRADARMDRADERMSRADASWEARMNRAEKRMKGFEQLVRIGMKELANQRKELANQRKEQISQRKDTDSKINALIDSQQRTEAVLRRFMSSFPKGGNGHARNQN